MGEPDLNIVIVICRNLNRHRVSEMLWPHLGPIIIVTEKDKRKQEVQARARDLLQYSTTTRGARA
jgi:hypothetical protein